MTRKKLDDAIHGDRSGVRSNKYMGSSSSVLDDWDAWDKHKKANGYSSYGDDEIEFGSAKSKGGAYKSCYHTHPTLKLPGTEFVCYGGSCSSPVVKDADVYIGFDLAMTFSARSWPWKQGTEFLFKITDMSAPSNPAEFVKLVAWAKEQIDAGKKLHAGCIGGHGRTGTFLAALVSQYGEEDAIAYVRKNYCAKAVESPEQVKFLQTHFGILPVKGSKSTSASSGSSASFLGKSGKGKGSKDGAESFKPLAGNGAIWG